MDTLLVTGTAVAGLVIGGALDPVGQRLADRSRREDERRRADRLAAEEAAARAGATHEDADHGTVIQAVEHLEETAHDAWSAADADDSDDPEPVDTAVSNLLPSGPSPARLVASGLLTGVLFGGAATTFGRDLVLAPYCVFFAMLVMVAITDLTHRLVPRYALYGALALIIPLLVASSAVDHTWTHLSGAAIGGVIAFGLFFAIWWFIPQGMGFGDVRLSGTIGLTVGYLSLLHAYFAFLAGFVIGMVFGLGMMAFASAGRKTRIPFAPSLGAGAAIAVLWGGQMAHSLFHAGS